VLSAVRDEIVEAVTIKNQNVCLNMMIGILTLNSNNQVFFKSHSPQEIASAGGSRLTKAGLEELGLSR